MQDLRRQIADIMEGKNQAYKDVEHPTIFHELLECDLPPQEKSLHRMGEEAQLVVAAGLETTAWALSVSSFHYHQQPRSPTKVAGGALQCNSGRERTGWTGCNRSSCPTSTLALKKPFDFPTL